MTWSAFLITLLVAIAIGEGCWRLSTGAWSWQKPKPSRRPCFHLFVDGFGGMGDALVCVHCGLDRYPEALPFGVVESAELLGRIIRTDDPDWEIWAGRARKAREARRRREEHAT